MEQNNTREDANNKLKMAIAMALFKSKLLQNQKRPSDSVTNDAPPNDFQSDDALKWKRKAKERKREILRLQEDLKIAEDGAKYDVFPQNASCKCYFFDKMAELIKNNEADHESGGRFKDVLRRRFMRQVRISERGRRRNGRTAPRHISGTNIDNEIEQLSASVDFLVDLSETVPPVSMEDKMHKSWSHQAVDFILTTLKYLLEEGQYVEPLEGIVSSLVIRLLRRMCNISHNDESCDLDTNVQIYIQHLLRKLGSEPYVGQRVILRVSESISTAAESLLSIDPFDDAFPNLHNSMYTLIQMIEFLISDYFINWSTREDFDFGLLEEWLALVLQARKALELLENRNGLYALYIDRVIGVIGKQVGESSCFQRLNPNLRSALFS